MTEIIILLLAFIALSFSRASAWVWHAMLATLTLAFSLYVSIYWLILGVLWLPFAIPPIRLFILSTRMLRFFNSNIPEMGDTEREALAAGDVWWEGELFTGRPRWDVLHKYPKPTLSAQEKAFLDNEVSTLCDLLDDWKITENIEKDLPADIWSYLKEQGFFGLTIEKKYGGLGFSALAHSAVITKLGTRSVTAAITAMVPNSLGPGELLHVYGTDAQKDYYLPRLAKGVDIPCFALTAAHSGSDAATMRDIGVVCRSQHQGKEIIGIRLNFDKRYITLAPVASLIGLAIILYDPDKLLGDKENIGITLCLIPADHPGIETGARHLPMQMPFMNGPVRGKDVFIPLDWVIGGPSYVGQGWKMLMNCLSTGRSISLPAISSAASQLCYRMTGAYARLRKQFNMPIAKFEGVEALLARIAGLNYIMLSCKDMTAAAVDLGVKPSLVSAIAKYHTTEMARQVVSDAMDIHGGRAIQAGPKNYLLGAYQAIPIGITVEGANILTRNLIIFGQGLMRCHPYLLEEMNFAREGNLGSFDKTLVKHIAFVVSNAVRTFVYGLGRGHNVKAYGNKAVSRFYKQLTRMSAALAFISDISILFFGGKLKRKERTSARLGDMLSYLYLASTVLKRFSDQKHPGNELPFVVWSCEYCLYQLQIAIDAFLQNFPNRFIRGLMKRIIFPTGGRFRLPSDKLDREIVQPMLNPSALRDALTPECYVGNTVSDVTGCLDLTLEKLFGIEASDKKFIQALKSGSIPQYQSLKEQLAIAKEQSVLTPEELDTYQEFLTMYEEVIAVDEFNLSSFYKGSSS